MRVVHTFRITRCRLEDKINFYEIVKVIETPFDFDRHYSVRATIVENRLMLIIDFHQVMHGN